MKTKRPCGFAVIPSAVSFLLAGVAVAQGGATWLELNPTRQPLTCWGHAMAYDAARQNVVLFGGYDGQTWFDTTWEWNGTEWRQAAPRSSPTARGFHDMAYDAARGRTVLFGGVSSSLQNPLSDTWEWDGVDWTLVVPPVSPSGRVGHAMVYDAARQRVVLFGGSDQGLLLADTWEWDGVVWTQATPAGSPSARESHDMAYDAARRRVVLYGGLGPGGSTDDTWEWDGLSWTPIVPEQNPGRRMMHAMTFDASRQRVVLFSGYPCCNIWQDDTWEWDGVNWTNVLPVRSPTGRLDGRPLAYDIDRERAVLFGCRDLRPPQHRTWEYGSLSPAGFTTYGTGCPGGSGDLTLQNAPLSSPWTGDTFRVELGNLPARSLPFMVVGLSNTSWAGGALPRDLSGFGLGGCWQLNSAEAMEVLTLRGGAAVWTVTVPASSALAGFSLFLQGAALSAGGGNPLGAAFSIGGEAVVGMR